MRHTFDVYRAGERKATTTDPNLRDVLNDLGISTIGKLFEMGYQIQATDNVTNFAIALFSEDEFDEYWSQLEYAESMRREAEADLPPSTDPADPRLPLLVEGADGFIKAFRPFLTCLDGGSEVPLYFRLSSEDCDAPYSSLEEGNFYEILAAIWEGVTIFYLTPESDEKVANLAPYDVDGWNKALDLFARKNPKVAEDFVEILITHKDIEKVSRMREETSSSSVTNLFQFKIYFKDGKTTTTDWLNFRHSWDVIDKVELYAGFALLATFPNEAELGACFVPKGFKEESPVIEEKQDATRPKHHTDFLDHYQWLDVESRKPRYRNDPDGFIHAVHLQVDKYMDRCGRKDNELQEYEKANFYLNYIIEFIKNGKKPILAEDIHKKLGR